MGVFPEEACFVCKKCGTNFFYKRDELGHINKQRVMGCPGCKSISNKPGHVEKYFRFYPRLIDSMQAIKYLGYEFVSYVPCEDDLLHCMFIESLEFKCLKCNKLFKISSQKAVKYASEPGLFCCNKCRIKPAKLKALKEFFVCYKNVYKYGAISLYPFVWDI